MKRHYTYYLLADEPYLTCLIGNGLPWMYIGVRTAKGAVDTDVYMGSSEYVKAAMSAGITFTKTIIRKHFSRHAANQDEKQLLENFRHEHGSEVWGYLYNRVVPGEFGEHTKIGMRIKAIADSVRKTPVYVRPYADAHPVATRRGGPSADYETSDAHRSNLRLSGKSYWDQMREYCQLMDIHDIGKGACNVDREAFRAWRNSASAAVKTVDNEGVLGNLPSPETANLRMPLTSNIEDLYHVKSQ